MFERAKRGDVKLKMAIVGLAKTGKTYSSLAIACGIAQAENKRVAFVDTENGAASLYSDKFDFDTMNLTSGDPRKFIEVIEAAEKDNSYSVIVIDSLSYEWDGPDGELALVDKFAKLMKDDTIRAWAQVSKLRAQMFSKVIHSPLHIIATVRAKSSLVIGKDNNNKVKIEKIAMKPIQKDGFDYEFSILGGMTESNTMKIGTGTRFEILKNYETRPTQEFGVDLVKMVKGEAHEIDKHKINSDDRELTAIEVEQ